MTNSEYINNNDIEFLLEDIDTDMSKITQEEFSKISKELWVKFGKNIELLLKQIETQERVMKLKEKYINSNSLQLANALTKELEDFKDFFVLKNLMIKAYQIIHEFREYVTKENIEYFIQVGTGQKTSKYSQIQLKELINYLSLSVDSNKNFRLSLIPNKAKEIKTSQAIDAFRSSLYDIQKTITTIKKAAQENINQGFVLEAALNIIAEKGPNVKITKSIVKKYYKPGNLPGTRGGDIGEKNTQKLIEQGMININKKLQLQAKKVSGSLGAAVVSITNIKSELFNLCILIKEIVSGRLKQNDIKKYFKSKKRASDIANKIKKEINNIVEQSLSETLSSIDNKNIKTKTFL